MVTKIPKEYIADKVVVADAAQVFLTAEQQQAAGNIGLGTTNTPTFTGINVGEDNLTVYDEGTWTPVVKIDTTTISTSTSGYYTRIGNTVFFSASLTFDRGSNTGDVTCEGLPVSSNANNKTNITVIANDNIDADPPLLGQVAESTTVVDFYTLPNTTGASLSAMDDSRFNSGSRTMWISGFYFA